MNSQQKKKNPLTVPPDINELPVPLDQDDENQTKEDDIDIKKVLEINESQDTDVQNSNESQNSLEETILEKINE